MMDKIDWSQLVAVSKNMEPLVEPTNSLKKASYGCMMMVPCVKHISYSEEPGNRNVTVVFDDGDVRVERLMDGDVFDLQIGVALVIAHKMYGSKNAFKREVNKAEDVWKKKRERAERKRKAKERDGEI